MKIFSQLEQLLQEEQKALLSGDFSALETLAERKEALLELLISSSPHLPKNSFQILRDKALKNEALLNSAKRGLQAALVRVRLSNDSTPQTTYSKNGERRAMSKPPSSVAQKI
ncbi:MAG: hypothetical protein ACU0GG_18665 [Paracoccaceae bacterium]